MENLEKLSDRELIEISRNGKKQSAYNELFRRYDSKIYRFLFSKSKQKEDARDWTQEVFLKVFKAIEKGKYQEKDSFKSWIFTIAYHHFINYERRRKRTNEIYGETLTKEIAFNDGEYSIKNRDEIVSEEFNKISEKIRIPFEMHFEGYEYKEIAEKLELKIGTVKSRIFYAKKTMRERLLEKYPEFCEEYKHNI